MLQRDSHIKALFNNTVTQTVAFTLSIVILSGCSSFALNDGSVDYLTAQRINPVQVPANLQTRPIAPLYPVPIIPENNASKQLTLTNAKGNRYQLPKPIPVNTNQINEALVNTAVSQPQLVLDGHGYPLLKIGGDPTKILEVLKRSLNVANVNVKVKERNSNQFLINHDKLAHELHLGRIGDTTTLTVLKTDETFTSFENATEILELIIRNWSAS